MSLYEKILEKALSRGRVRRIVDIRIGLGYTAVCLDNGNIGLAYTYLEEKAGCNILPPEVRFYDRPADVVAKYFLSPNLIEAGVGLATINAILNCPKDDYTLGDPLQLLELNSKDRVAMVGYFEPLAKRIKDKVQDLWIFEKSESRLAEALAEVEMTGLLPEATVAIITSVTLINKTLEEILLLLKGVRASILLGPSTPLLAEPFEGQKITYLSGMVVKDKEILKIVSEAKGTKAFGPFVQKVNLALKKA